MFKKIGWSILFFLVIQVVLYSCCKEKTYNVDLQHIKIVYDNNEAQTVTSEDLIVYLDFVYNYDEVASILNSNFNFNTALATTCPNDIYNYNFSFTDLNITADADINGIEAGLSINSIMKFSYNNIDDLLDISQFYNPTNNEDFYTPEAPETLLFVFDQDIPANTQFKLTFTVQTSNEITYTFTSNTYIIE